jgi:predicted ATP-dependent endonuclease of OLD family
MLNKTFPSRHRLVITQSTGTEIDTKPYIGRWGTALQALGISMSGTILFADYVLLCEGDSESILIPTVFQFLAAHGQIETDLNSFSVIGTGDTRNTEAIIRIMTESRSKPSIAVLVDGDAGGKARLRALKPIMDSRSLLGKALLDDTTIEDYLPLANDLYVEAVVRYSVKLAKDHGKASIDESETRETVRQYFSERVIDKKTKGNLSTLATEIFQEITELTEPPSKMGIAREYVLLLEEVKPNSVKDSDLRQAQKLFEIIQSMLQLPGIADIPNTIISDD